MRGKIENIEKIHYAYVTKITVNLGAIGQLAFEVPNKVLDEINWVPGESEEVEIGFDKDLGDTENWDIVLQGEVYLKKEEDRKIIASMGGLQVALTSEKLYRDFSVGDKVFLKVKRLS